MSRLARLQEDLQQVSRAVARAERTLADHPNVPSVVATLQSITSRRQNLEEEFLEEAAAIGLDACSYRIEFESASASIAGIAASLGLFQKTFTTVYDAIVNGIKKSAKAGQEVVAATRLDYGYAFEGSLGIMMTIPSEKDLVGRNKLQEAMGMTFQLLNARSTQEVEAMTEKVGLPAVRQAYAWASENAKAGFGTDIKWVTATVEASVLPLPEIYLQPAEVQNLAYQFSSAIAREQQIVEGVLTKVGMADKTFEMTVGGKTICGTFDKAISDIQPAEVPHLYKATLEIATRIAAPSEGGEEITYFLVRLGAPATRSAEELGL